MKAHAIYWLAPATRELLEATDRYRSISPELGRRFFNAVDDLVRTISLHPFRFPVVSKERRRAGLRYFPYAIIFEAQEDRIIVIACFHGRRNPAVWHKRSS